MHTQAGNDFNSAIAPITVANCFYVPKPYPYPTVLIDGAGKEIREAIADPSPQCQEKAWAAVLPLVIKLKRCYEHSLELEKIVPKLLGQLVGGKLNPTQHLETQQALVKQLAEILEFVLKFDEHKSQISS
uniref:CYRIA/CYRIB Rac1 binding domain-containing protein n=1 Tax=Glossina austeni TaxID=7395 RepID=A0A1A9VYH8_GLOAU